VSVSLRGTLDAGDRSMRAEARERGFDDQPVSLRWGLGAPPRIHRFDHDSDVHACIGAETTLRWTVEHVERATVKGGEGGWWQYTYDGDVRGDALEVTVDHPPTEFELEAVGEVGPSRTATTTVERLRDQHVYYRELRLRNPSESDHEYEVSIDGPGGREHVATLSPGERTVIEEGTLRNCARYRLEARGEAGGVDWSRSFVYLTSAYTVGWSLPPE
jgi:hypothetical protein